ncbi:MAG TPA: CIA30 family protein [Kofleriaceae bacterium]
MTTRPLLLFLLLLACGSHDAAEPPPRPAAGAFAVRGARVFDGERAIGVADVLVEGGRIAAVGRGLSIPAGVPVIDGRGKTLLPGLIDGHVHAFGDARRDALRFGVTTELDMFSDWHGLAAARAERASLDPTAQADLWSAGTLATAAGGHGTQFGVSVPTLSRPDEAEAWVAARVAEGSDWIKIVREDGSAYGAGGIPTLDARTAAALVAAAHAHELLAVMHVSTLAAAREGLAAGADGFAHVFHDRPADDDFVALARQRGAFVVPTLVLFSGADQANALASVRRLHAAGVEILAGTDAPNAGTKHGASLHDELERLVEAGLRPDQALAAATSRPAAVFRLGDRGRIARGMRADLLLVDGDPLREIRATRSIARIWKNGAPVDRTPPAPAPAAARPAAPRIAAGPVSDFEAGTAASRVGHGWEASSDAVVKGASKASIRPVAPGAGGSKGALEVSGTVEPGFIFPFAGATLFAGAQPMEPADLSGLRELVFRVKGDGKTYRVVVLSREMRGMPPMQEFVAGPDWSEVRLRLDGFAGADLAAVGGLSFSAGPATGPFRFLLDDVQFR